MSDTHSNNNRPSWQADNTHPETIKTFIQAMTEVIDPELGLNIIQLGLIRDLHIEVDSATVTMIMTTPFCPYAPAMLEMTRQKAESALGMSTKVTLGMEMWNPSMMEEGLGGDWGLY